MPVLLRPVDARKGTSFPTVALALVFSLFDEPEGISGDKGT